MFERLDEGCRVAVAASHIDEAAIEGMDPKLAVTNSEDGGRDRQCVKQRRIVRGRADSLTVLRGRRAHALGRGRAVCCSLHPAGLNDGG